MRLRHLIPLCIAALSVAACDGGTPGTETTLSQVQAQVLTPSCATSNCHAGGSPSAGLDLSAGAAHGALVNQPSGQKPNAPLVVPGDPAGSYLVDKIVGAADIAGQAMPIGERLTPEEIALVRRWIEAGARNN